MSTKAVEKLGIVATCGHINTRLDPASVFINGIPAIRIGDLAGGVIIGPGNPTVFMDGKPVSLEGDIITPHDSDPTHFATTGIVPGANVFA